MKSPHAAALALLGWYLMLAPIREAPGGRSYVDIEAPLNQWTVTGAFDRADSCQQAKARGQREGKEQKFHPAGGERELEKLLWIDFIEAQCIASDDPRLAK